MVTGAGVVQKQQQQRVCGNNGEDVAIHGDDDDVNEEPSTPNSHDLHLKIANGIQSKDLSEIRNENKDGDTPSSIMQSFLFGGKESWVEELLDGSLMSEMEGGDPVNTTEKLKSALRVLKAELEEERSASAIAASETMAMITRHANGGITVSKNDGRTIGI